MGPDEVRRIANLARLGVPDEQLAALAAELSSILEHMAVLREVDTDGVPSVSGLGAGAMPLRDDAGAPIPLTHSLGSFAPARRDGFLLVPRLATHEDAEDAEASAE
ncbi:MAG: Asp-tRNA(Asn)/Glu-tRNA(Gln) amidotransferase subunit GatC [Gemmatimonadaceae bacterium]